VTCKAGGRGAGAADLELVLDLAHAEDALAQAGHKADDGGRRDIA
jgi:hypothetical protein